MFSIIALVLGITTGAYALYVRRNCERNRRMLSQKGTIDERIAYVFLPGLSLLFFGLGFLQVAVVLPGIAESVALTGCVVLSLFGFILLTIATLRLPYPHQLVPAWARSLANQRDCGKLPASQTRSRPDWQSRQRRLAAEERELKRQARRERKAQKRSMTSAKKRRPR